MLVIEEACLARNGEILREKALFEAIFELADKPEVCSVDWILASLRAGETKKVANERE